MKKVTRNVQLRYSCMCPTIPVSYLLLRPVSPSDMNQLCVTACTMMFHFFVQLFLVASFSPPLEAALSNETRVIKLGIVLNVHSKGPLPFDYYNMEPALGLAMERSRQDFGIEFQPFLSLYDGEYCDELSALAQVMRAVNNSVDLVVGPGCSDDLALAARVTTILKVPLISGGGSNIDSTAQWPYVVRMVYNTRTQWSLFVLMAQKYNWTNVFVIYEYDDQINGPYAQSLVRYMRMNQLVPIEYLVKSTEIIGPKNANVILQAVSDAARVVFFLINPHNVRKMLLEAQCRNMCNGEFAFFAWDVMKTEIIDAKSWERDRMDIRDDRDDSLTCQAFFVLAVRFRPKQESFKAFKKAVLDRALIMPGGQVPDVNYWSTSFYDVLYAYATVLNETFADGLDFSKDNLDYISKKFRDRRFKGCNGIVYMDSNNDRADDYQMYQMAPLDTEDMSSKFSLIAEYYGYKNIYEPYRAIRWPSPDNSPVINRPFCDYDGFDPICVIAARTTIGASLGGVIAVLIVGGWVAFALYRHLRWRSKLNNLDWLASWTEITVHQSQRSVLSVSLSDPKNIGQDQHTVHPQIKSLVHLAASRPTRSRQSLQKSTTATKESFMKTNTIVATFRHSLTMLRPCPGAHVVLSTAVREEVRQIKGMKCESLLEVVAACIDPEHVAVLLEYCSRGMLQDVLQNDAVPLDWVFRISFINDVVSALAYVHGSFLQHHGRLSSKCCYIDKRFVLKIGDYGLPSFYNHGAEVLAPADLLWTAPEVLRSSKHGLAAASQPADVFAFAIILQEIVMRESPYFLNNHTAEEIVRKVRITERPPYRPIVRDTFCQENIILLMKSCWAEYPAERPNLAQIKGLLRTSSKTNGRQRDNIVDTLIDKMEQYAASLELSVDEKTQALVEEKKKTNQLLYSILPKAVAEQLKRGEPVLPESYEGVTIYFGDIVEFTKLSAASSAFEIVTLMNDLYGKFDQIILTYDAYKVETIGDCYVIVSGLPHRNGEKHAGVIARLALALRDSVVTFRVQHMPGKNLQLRIGLNSGPCVAGVVGFATPRYCLFGDTVNVAARMESTGEPRRIQISQATENILRYLGSFDIEDRGTIPVKGKGEMHTYWLNGELPPK